MAFRTYSLILEQGKELQTDIAQKRKHALKLWLICWTSCPSPPAAVNKYFVMQHLEQLLLNFAS